MAIGSTRLPPPNSVPRLSSAAVGLGGLVAAFLRGVHLLVALLQLVPKLLQLAERDCSCRTGRWTCPSPRIAAAERAAAEDAGANHSGADHQSPDRRDHDRQDDRADDDDDRVPGGLVVGTLHQARKAEIQQIEAVQPREHAQDSEQRKDLQHARHPGRRVRVHRDLERLRAVFLPAEAGRERVDDRGQDEDADDRHHEREHGQRQSGRDRHAIRADERQGPSDQRPAEEPGHGADRRERHDVAADQRSSRCLFRRDDRPLGARRQTDVLRSLDDVHDRSFLVTRTTLFSDAWSAAAQTDKRQSCRTRTMMRRSCRDHVGLGGYGSSGTRARTTRVNVVSWPPEHLTIEGV